MAKFVMDIQKGDNYSTVEYDSKIYILSDQAPFNYGTPLTLFKDDGTGTLVDSNNNPIEAVELISLHLKTYILDLSDIIFRTDGQIYHAVTD